MLLGGKILNYQVNKIKKIHIVIGKIKELIMRHDTR